MINKPPFIPFFWKIAPVLDQIYVTLLSFVTWIKDMPKSEMRLFDPNTNERLFLIDSEMKLFLKEANKLPKAGQRIFCQILQNSGALLSEVSELTPDRFNYDKYTIRFRTMKKRGEPVYRDVPIDKRVMESADLYFRIRATQKKQTAALDLPLWPHSDDKKKPMTRQTGWRIVTGVFERIEEPVIKGKKASPNGLRHGYGVSKVLEGMDLKELQKRMGHSSQATTAIYLQALTFNRRGYD